MALSRRSLPGPGLKREDAGLGQGTDSGNKDKEVKPGGVEEVDFAGQGGGRDGGQTVESTRVLSRELGGTSFPPPNAFMYTPGPAFPGSLIASCFSQTPLYECE